MNEQLEVTLPGGLVLPFRGKDKFWELRTPGIILTIKFDNHNVGMASATVDTPRFKAHYMKVVGRNTLGDDLDYILRELDGQLDQAGTEVMEAKVRVSALRHGKFTQARPSYEPPPANAYTELHDLYKYSPAKKKFDVLVRCAVHEAVLDATKAGRDEAELRKHVHETVDFLLNGYKLDRLTRGYDDE